MAYFFIKHCIFFDLCYNKFIKYKINVRGIYEIIKQGFVGRSWSGCSKRT